MNPQAKKRLTVSILILILACFGLYLYFNNNQAQVIAESAQLKSQTYDVGTPYSGQITHQFVQEGDTVKAGQPLFYVDSAELKASLSQAKIDKKSLDLSFTDSNEIIIAATKPGIVKTLQHTQGSFVPSNTVLATIAQTKNLRAEASVSLSPDQYSKIDKRSRLLVTLPDGKIEATKISNITIVNQGDQVIAKVTGDLPDVRYDPLTTKDGAPVKVTIRIEMPLWQRIIDAIVSWSRSLF